MVLFDLDDVLMIEGNYLPSHLFDQFSIQLVLSSAGQIVPVDITGTDAVKGADYYIVLSNVELHIYYYNVSSDQVLAQRQAAQVLESDGTSAYGLSFLTKRIGCVLRQLQSGYMYEHSIQGNLA